MCDTQVNDTKDTDTESYWDKIIKYFKFNSNKKNQNKNLSLDELEGDTNHNMNNLNDTIFLVSEVQKLVSVFNANYQDQIQVHISIQPDINVIFSNKLFCISALSNFLHYSFQNIKRKIRLSNKDIQEIVIYFRIEDSSLNKSYTSMKQIRVDIFDTGSFNSTSSSPNLIIIWNQLSKMFGITQSFSLGTINYHIFKNNATLFLPFRLHPMLLSVKRELLCKNIFRISKTYEEILRLRVGYNKKDHVWKDSLTDHSKIENSNILVVIFDEMDDLLVKSSRRYYYYSEEWDIADIVTFKKFDYSRISEFDCIVLDFKNFVISKNRKFIGQLGFFFNTLAVIRYDMILVALLDENDENNSQNTLGNCDYVMRRPFQQQHIINILEKIRMRKLEQILSI